MYVYFLVVSFRGKYGSTQGVALIPVHFKIAIVTCNMHEERETVCQNAFKFQINNTSRN
jgi:hypothetical protein